MASLKSLNQIQIRQILSESNFSFLNLILLFKLKIRLLVWVILGSLCIGGLIYLTSPNSYQINTILLVETNPQGSSSKGLGALAQVSGINLGNSSVDQAFLDPSLYPVIVQSKPFLLELMTAKVKSDYYEDSVSLFKYMVEIKPENEILKLIKNPLGLFKSNLFVDDLEHPGIDQSKSTYLPLEIYAMSQIGKRISISTEGSLLTITTEMPEPDLSFQFSKKVKSLIEKYSIRYVLEKQNNQVEYLKAQFLAAEKNYQDAQNNLVRFKERNQGINLESLRAVEQNLNSEYNLKFELFRTISQELELAKIKLNSLKPIFSQIEPPYIPNRPTSPKLLFTIAFSFTLGIVVGMILIFFFYTYMYFKLQ
ncbi:hypothetical protein [Algoriphagus formosus]|uniref:hypothetical protein n=1 Tax=Algoriphagus formosus TaxID=2007308 RepID=UPI003F713261